jgi:hypothetical protein
VLASNDRFFDRRRRYRRAKDYDPELEAALAAYQR